MHTKSLMGAVLAAASLGFIPAASGQGTVNSIAPSSPVSFTTLSSSNDLSAYVGQTAWILLLDVQHNGTGSLVEGSSTNFFQTELNVAYNASISLSATNGTVSVSDQIINGRFNTTGYTAGTSISSLSPVSGLVIAIENPYWSSGESMTADNLYLGSVYQPTVADTSSGSFAGTAGLFETPVSSFSAVFSLDQTMGTGDGQVYVIGLSPVPEPSVLALTGIGLLFLMYRRR